MNNIVADQLEKFGLDRAQTLIYACGHPGMIEASREIVTSDGLRLDRREVLDGVVTPRSRSASTGRAEARPVLVLRAPDSGVLNRA